MSRSKTPSQTVGPYYAIGLCRRAENVLDESGIELVGTLIDGQGEPVLDGLVEVWDSVGRRWGRSGTYPGQFSFRISPDTQSLDAYVHARGLLRHQRTRVYLKTSRDSVLDALPAHERATLVAKPEGDRLRFDIRLQGDRQTVFFAQ
jgi:protocatechuate 3,4-dioxygenase, alpha subunit